MIYTVTLNPAIDKTVVIENLNPGSVNRVTSVREDPGGKGINVSKCLKNLGLTSTAVMILAGNAGDRLEQMLQALEIPVLQLRAEGQNRINLKIIDPVKKENTDINEPGPEVSEELLEQLKLAIGHCVQPEDIVILLRSPGSVGGQFQRALEARGIRCASGGGNDLLQTQEIQVLRSPPQHGGVEGDHQGSGPAGLCAGDETVHAGLIFRPVQLEPMSSILT